MKNVAAVAALTAAVLTVEHTYDDCVFRRFAPGTTVLSSSSAAVAEAERADALPLEVDGEERGVRVCSVAMRVVTNDGAAVVVDAAVAAVAATSFVTVLLSLLLRLRF